MSELEFTVHGHLPDGGEIRRYSDGQWWVVGPEGSYYPGEHLGVKRAAIRAARWGTPILGVAHGRVFDQRVRAELSLMIVEQERRRREDEEDGITPPA